jgi:hypothetical protein
VGQPPSAVSSDLHSPTKPLYFASHPTPEEQATLYAAQTKAPRATPGPDGTLSPDAAPRDWLDADREFLLSMLCIAIDPHVALGPGYASLASALVARLKASHPMLDAVIDEQEGRRIRIGDHWLADFASCNYLGLDLDKEVIDAVPEYLARWGTHPSWSRLLGSPVLYEQLEETTTALLGSEDSLLLPTITHIHMSVIPVLVGMMWAIRAQYLRLANAARPETPIEPAKVR